MKALSPEAVYKVNWTLRNLSHLNQTRVLMMAKTLFNQRSVKDFAPTFDVPEHWAPVVHSALWSLVRRIPTVQFLEVSEKAGALNIEIMCEMEDRPEANEIMATCNHRIDLLTQERLNMARSRGLLEEEE